MTTPAIASMRPELFAPENQHPEVEPPLAFGASMRPELFAPENSSSYALAFDRSTCFNEAGAVRSGKPVRGGAVAA